MTSHHGVLSFLLLFFFNDTATTEIYTLSLHDALPICAVHVRGAQQLHAADRREDPREQRVERDRKSTRLNSSHTVISYAVFCLKKKTDDERFVRRHLRPRDGPHLAAHRRPRPVGERRG